jgi:hypothetical protein
MKKLYCKIFIATFFVTTALNSCKLDAPVYPSGTIETGTGSGSGTGSGTGTGTGTGSGNGTGTGTGSGTGTGTGSGTGTGTGTGTGSGTGTGGTENTGEGLPIGAENTIKIQLTAGGAIKTYSTNVVVTSISGISSIIGLENINDMVSLGWFGDTSGTYDLAAAEFGTEYSMASSGGKIKITSFSYNTTTYKGSTTGTFSVDLEDTSGKLYPHVTGSFNIKMK